MLSSSRICHACWLRSDRRNTRSRSISSNIPSEDLDEETDSIGNESTLNAPQGPEMESTIFLPNYVRSPDTQRCCFFPGCTGTDRRTVPSSLRVRLFCDYSYYVRYYENNYEIQNNSIKNDVLTIQKCF